MSEKNPENLRLEDSAGYLANHMARLFANALAERLKEIGMAPAQFAVMLALRETGASLQKELVEILDMEQATVANTLSRMERDGLVVRTPYEKDARVQKVSLTENAEAKWHQAMARAMEVNKAALGGLSTEERAEFIRLLRKVVSTQRAVAGKPPRAWETR